MSELIWLNGETLNMSDARIGVEDRGYQFADGVYEVIRLYNGRPFTLHEHLARLERSARGIELFVPVELKTLADEVTKFISRAGVRNGMIYMQLTRGSSPRNHIFPDASSTRPTLLFYARPLPPVPAPGAGEGVKLWPVVDERWKRCWVKSIALLANVLAKNAAVSRGYDEAVFVEDGFVSECSASNIHVVKHHTLVTAPPGPKVLGGVTRDVLLKCAADCQIKVEQRLPSEAEVLDADEVFITSTTREISFATHWGERTIGENKCGPTTLALHHLMLKRITEDAK